MFISAIDQKKTHKYIGIPTMDLIDNHKNALAYLGKITHFWNFVILELDWWWWMHCALLAPLLAEI